MAKKSYDQRLKERWKRKEQKDYHKEVIDFYGLKDMFDRAALILPFLFGKRNR